MTSPPSNRHATVWLFVIVVSLGLIIGAGSGLLAARRSSAADGAAASGFQSPARSSPSELQGLVQRALKRLPRPGRPPAS